MILPKEDWADIALHSRSTVRAESRFLFIDRANRWQKYVNNAYVNHLRSPFPCKPVSKTEGAAVIRRTL
jgi:hypothetical protein